MGATTEIAWTDHTFNIVWGCTKVSDACKFCYAEAFAKRTGHDVWGANADRRILSDAYWKEPLKWNAAAKAAGERKRVFCSSMADVFEDHPTVESQRQRLWSLIAETPALDWQLLTKRPENMVKLAPASWAKAWPHNVWAGATVENQKAAEQRVPWLIEVPASVLFLSCEPLLEAIDLENVRPYYLPPKRNEFEPDVWIDALRGHVKGPDDMLDRRIGWVIVGGESGGSARPFGLAWARSILKQCADAHVPAFFKQAGRLAVDSERIVGVFAEHDKRSIRAATLLGAAVDCPPNLVPLWSPKGGDLSELPKDLHVRQFPEAS
jgi:protein gp37